jgi:uncharacterized protein YdhG (YjbR/CyaY superfamily)
MAKAPKPQDIDGYISQLPAGVQAILERVRQTIREAAPDARETISYRMPAFKQHGILVFFAAWKQHIGLYPPISGDTALERAVSRYAGPKGNLQLPLDEPIPYDLIERRVKLRAKRGDEQGRERIKVRRQLLGHCVGDVQRPLLQFELAQVLQRTSLEPLHLEPSDHRCERLADQRHQLAVHQLLQGNAVLDRAGCDESLSGVDVAHP